MYLFIYKKWNDLQSEAKDEGTSILKIIVVYKITDISVAVKGKNKQH
jgi:hypothetical protein